MRYLQATLLLISVVLALYCTVRTAAPRSAQPVKPPNAEAPSELDRGPVEAREKDLESKEYAWTADLAGDQRIDQIQTGSGDLPIVFDDEHSNRMALESFRALRLGVIQCNAKSGKVLLLGKYDPSGQSFALDHWTIALPFMISIPEDDSIGDHHVMRLDTRRRLLREDFRQTASFDPNSKSFSPQRHERIPAASPPGTRPN